MWEGKNNQIALLIKINLVKDDSSKPLKKMF